MVIDPNTPGVAQVLAASNQLAERLNKCMNQLQAVSFQLSGTVDSFTDTQEKLREEIRKLGTKMEAQSHALTTVGASLSMETNEIGTRQRKAFAGHFLGSILWNRTWASYKLR